MTKIRPINPDEIIREKAEAIPDQVIAGFNELIARNWNNGKAIIFTDDVLEIIQILTGASKDTIIQNHWLDVEPIYSEHGYVVVYCESKGLDSFPSYYEFRKKS